METEPRATTIARPTVAIVGAGFSGLLTALHLVSMPHGPNVRLIERRGAFGRGAAYSTLDPAHLLNVRASNMSAFPEVPSHFVDWLSEGGREEDQSPFVLRRRYGDYLQAMIQKAVETAPAGQFLLEPDSAVGVERAGQGWTVTLAMGRSFYADAVILAIGNLPPGPPAGFSTEATRGPDYIPDPWSLDAKNLPEDGDALLIGTGLSMVDVALHLTRLKPGLQMLALSRRGLLPRRHLTEGPQAILRLAPPSAVTPLQLLQTLRLEAQGKEWRAVFDGLRPHVHAIWRNWPLKERRRFLRHARPWWDVHRHRLAPVVAASLDQLITTGRLRVRPGRVRSVTKSDDGLYVVWRPRGDREDRNFRAALVVNCAGPNGDLQGCDDPLLRRLFDTGVANLDPCRLGLDTDPDARLIAADGAVNDTIFAVGPIARGALWEITSVPDIRIQAAACARAVSDRLLNPATPR